MRRTSLTQSSSAGADAAASLQQQQQRPQHQREPPRHHRQVTSEPYPLLSFEDAPPHMQINPHVVCAYRPLLSYRLCLRSLFRVHNEVRSLALSFVCVTHHVHRWLHADTHTRHPDPRSSILHPILMIQCVSRRRATYGRTSYRPSCSSA